VLQSSAASLARYLSVCSTSVPATSLNIVAPTHICLVSH
jgi:hypothetical protein